MITTHTVPDDIEILDGLDEVNDSYWLDVNTFVFAFGRYKDNDNNMFNYHCEYHEDENKFIFVRLYEYDTAEAKFTEQQKTVIIARMKQLMKG